MSHKLLIWKSSVVRVIMWDELWDTQTITTSTRCIVHCSKYYSVNTHGGGFPLVRCCLNKLSLQLNIILIQQIIHVITSLQNGEFLHDSSKQNNTHVIKRSGLSYEHPYILSPTADAFIKINFVVTFLSTYPKSISCNVCNSNWADNHFFGHAFISTLQYQASRENLLIK